MFNLQQARNAVLTAAAAGLFVCVPARAQTAADRLAFYETAISTGDPAAAAAFLADGEAVTLAEINFNGAAALKAKAAALKDLKDLLAMPWDKARANKLSLALSLRIDVSKPLAGLGIGPEPEKLLPWLARYQPAFPESKKEVVKNAIRQWEMVFGTITDTRAMSWAQADMFSGSGVTVGKAQWEGWTIRERNAVLAMLMTEDPAFTVYDDDALASAKEEMSLLAVVDNIKYSGLLSAPQLNQLRGKPFADQVYLLGSFFDGGNIAVDDVLKTRIHAARDSLPKEVLPAQQRALLGSMLATAMPGELAGTKAGDRVLAFYSKNGPFKIELKPCDGNYSRFDAATGAIVLDSETVQQYMRMKGYSAESLMSSREQVAEIAKYMSPMVVYEAAHHMQAVWAKTSGVYKPRVQEDEVEAMSLEGLYTSEKIDKDAAFRKIMSDSRDYASYASKRVAIATNFKKSGAKGFSTSVRQLYCSGLPSLDAAAAQVLGAVTGELGRRSGLPATGQAELEAVGLTLAEAMEMAPEELAGSVEEVRTGALVKIQKDLSAPGIYRARYAAADKETRAALKNLKAGVVANTSGPPAL
ncbi:MAG: hypothetical protein A2234_09645 [Elusimicrobia bacterium RIFOXYA2_FULL_58_8]|nr:MAG: hypothetical protein A2285_06935 [Elusimicrobia bacterium RIFOXYA12_FULL_57_11]OGS14055.1 MAG: hypothetical protein A2234_09645 [Elusimicrobia bacterium RIFOXYA2_FULL_58_8]